MPLKSCNTVELTKRCRPLILGLWTGNRERSQATKLKDYRINIDRKKSTVTFRD